ncbi:MAG: nucleoside-diphosphate kinase [Candidatus Heimdallarchaeota archaeon]|nr:nucleoside-diphosphate kinase [Candidatus Heimdallarchaeota archaeon]
MTEKTLLIIKPDAIQRGLIGEVISRIEKKGLQIIALRMMQLTGEQIDQLYDIHAEKEFYPILKSFILSGPLVAIAVHGNNCVKIVRKLAGATNSPEAEPGTIRGDFGINLTKNIVHSSDKPERAIYELSVLFTSEEYISYDLINQKWVQ